MARSSSNVADSLLASAHDSAVHDGLRLAVPRYLEAVEALVSEDRKEDAAGVLGELLAAKEKKRGFFLGKRDDNPLGPQRPQVAKRYAQVTRGAPPSETLLDTLGQIAVQYPDDPDVRLSNAEALKAAGYLLDALDEFKFCLTLAPEDVDLVVRVGELYVQLGRPEEAVAQARQAMIALDKSGNDAAVAALAARLLDYAPSAFEESFDGFLLLSGDALARNRGPFDVAVSAFERSGLNDPEKRAAVVSRIGSCFEKLLARDSSDQALWQALAKIDPPTADRIRRSLDGVAASAQVDGQAASAAPQAPVAPAAEAVAPPKRPAAGGLSAFTKRKALELFANSEYEAASVQLERVARMSPDVEALEMLLECYLVLDRHSDAARVGVALADAQVAAGNKPAAIAGLTTLSKKITDPTLEQRRVELMQNN